jgi:hypothetical protein
MLEDLRRRSILVLSFEIAPSIVPFTATFSAPMNPKMDVTGDGKGVVVNPDASACEPLRQIR